MEKRAARVEGGMVRYRELGAGDPLVLVHGLAGSWRWWSPLATSLAERHRLIVVDHPRWAAGSCGWLSRFLDAVGLEETALAGHSLGGLHAAELAASEPRRVTRLVLVAPAGVPCGRGLPGRTLPLLDALYGIRRSIHLVAADAMRAGPLALARNIAHALRSDLRVELSTVSAPTLLVWGARDRLVPSRLAEDWQELLPDARVALLGCGHVPMFEAPRELTGAILDFLAQRD